MECKYCKSNKLILKTNIGIRTGIFCSTCGKLQRYIFPNEILYYEKMGIKHKCELKGVNYKLL